MITTKRIRLRKKRLGDVVNSYAWQTDPELVHLDAAPLLTITFPQYTSFYLSELRHPSQKRQAFAIETLDGEHIGNCSYYDVNERKGEGQLGIMIGNRTYWDRGYGTEAVKMLLDHIFRNTATKRVYLKTLLMNIRAQRCFQKCGFAFYKHLNHNEYHFLLMELHRKQWQQRQLNNETERHLR